MKASYNFNDDLNEIDDFSILLTNLKLLGFSSTYPKEFQNFDKMSFIKTNSKLMSVILYYLICKFDKNFVEKFSFCFPVTTLNELKLFKENATTVIQQLFSEEIQNESFIFTKSILDSASGDRLIKFFRKLSDKLIRKEIHEMKKKLTNNEKIITQPNKIYTTNPSINQELNKFYNSNNYLNWKKISLLTNITIEKDKLIANCKKFDSLQDEWKKFATYLESEIQSLEKEKFNLQKKYKNFRDSIPDSSIFSEIAALDRAPKLENVKLFKEMLLKLDSHFEENSDFVRNLDYINENTNVFEYVLIT